MGHSSVQSGEIPKTLQQKLAMGGYTRPHMLAGITMEQLLSTCSMNLDELRSLQAYMAKHGLTFRSDPVRYPFINPLLLREIRSHGMDVSRTPIATIGLPRWAESALQTGGILTVGELSESSTFYVRTVLGHGGRPQSILRSLIEEYLLTLLEHGHEEGDETPHGTLQSLQLRPRTLRALRRAGIFTLFQLQRMSDPDLQKLRGIGEVGLVEIRAATPPHRATGARQPDLAIQAEAISAHPENGRTPITELDLPEFVVKRLESSGITTVGELVHTGADGLEQIPRIGKMSIERIRTALEQHMLTALSDIGKDVPEQVSEVQAEAASSTLDLRVQFLISKLASERQARLLRLRFGIDGSYRTLEETGDELGISRERARQLISAAVRTLRANHPEQVRRLVEPVVELLSTAGGSAPTTYVTNNIRKTFEIERMSLEGATNFLIQLAGPSITVSAGRCSVANASLSDIRAINQEIVELLTRRLAPMTVPELTQRLSETEPFRRILVRYPSFSLAACARANPNTRVMSDGRIGLSEWQRSRLDETVDALRAYGRPAHYSEIAARVQTLVPPGTSVSPRGIYNLLVSEAAFVRTGRGTFGLVEWQSSPEAKGK